MSSKDIKWPVAKVRSTFVEYFEKNHQHINVKSSPVVPVNDPTLLFANAGMNQFKPIFIGTVDPSSPLAELKRVVNSQKCIRAGGKHNDLDDVGKDTYHHTFFEMLGTWSFGNYFKKEAIEMAYDILVNQYKLPKERLYASYFGGDEAMGLPCDTEARDIWAQYLPMERILPFDKKANFWEMGDTGPCGPCSEIHFDRIGNRDASKLVNADDPDVIEIWNLVFIQYNREPSGELRLLPDKHIDTGMGLERLTSILQDKRSNYDTDVFMPIFKAIEGVTGADPYSGKLGADDAKNGYKDMAYRVVADHIRTLTLAITDGAVPSNEGRGYVLRRILRRAVRYGMQNLGGKPGFFATLVPTVVASLGDVFPEIKEKSKFVQSVISEEENSFSSLLENGVKYFSELVKDIKKTDSLVVKGEQAFYLYDTLGFPVDLTQLMAAEQGLTVDITGFNSLMNEQKDRSRVATKLKRLDGRGETLSLGAEQTSYLQKTLQCLPTNDAAKYVWDQSITTTVDAVYTSSGFVESIDTKEDKIYVFILKDTSFYAESGGQVPDSGVITLRSSSGKDIVFDVLDVQVYGGYVLHTCSLSELSSDIKEIINLSKNHIIAVQVDYNKRRKVAPNHTMTHVLNYALRHVIGGDIEQKGSQVNEEKLRFDFSIQKPVNINELIAIEQVVNDVITQQLNVYNEVVPLKKALEVKGLRAVFGEIYPDPVRVVSVGPSVPDLLANPLYDNWLKSSIEFCGGTHISNTKDALAFILIEETAVAKGIRRITGVTGTAAVEAKNLGNFLSNDIEIVLSDIKSNKISDISFLTRLEERIISLRTKLDESVVSVTMKFQARGQLEIAQKEIILLKNKLMMIQVDESIKLVKQQAIDAISNGKKAVILELNIGTDAKAIKRVLDEIKKVTDDKISFLCISKEENNGKITVFNYVTEEEQSKGIKANEWLNDTINSLGGKGGGKSGMAQGSLTNNDPNIVNIIIQNATKYITKTNVTH